MGSNRVTMTRNERIAYTAGMVSHSYHPQGCPYQEPKLREAYEKGLKDGKIANTERYGGNAMLKIGAYAISPTGREVFVLSASGNSYFVQYGDGTRTWLPAELFRPAK